MKLRFGDLVVDAQAASPGDFTPAHHEQFDGVRFDGGELRFTDPRWLSRYLGKGEEKAVYCVRDHDGRVFALEAIDEGGYLNGRFVDGRYFATVRAAHLAGVRFSDRALVGLRFSGLVKVREYAYGYEWARFQWRPDRPSRIDRLLTGYLRLFLAGRFQDYARRYGDVHERNVVFEIRSWRQRGVPVFARDATGRVSLVRVRLRPIDVR